MQWRRYRIFVELVSDLYTASVASIHCRVAPPVYLVICRHVIPSSCGRRNVDSRTCPYMCTELPQETRRKDVDLEDGAASKTS